MKLLRPVRCNFITQKFGENSAPFYAAFGWKGHNGVDFAMYGEEIIYWNGYDVDGKVVQTKIYDDGCMGVTILTTSVIDGYQVSFLHRFLHLRAFLCKPGDIMTAAKPIGIGDNTGKYTTGKHLHWDLMPVKIVNNSYVALDPNNGYAGCIDPLPYMKNEFVMDILKGWQKLLAQMTETLLKMKEALNKKVGTV
jgi:murein DD-endopeptidase MepM/ murein hydrolase activator NlpD